jgi:hypothetical protein
VTRRAFITLLAGAAAWPLAARAQQTAIRRIGVLMGFAENDHGAQSGVAGFREELRKLGWVEGHDIEIDIRWATAQSTHQCNQSVYCLEELHVGWWRRRQKTGVGSKCKCQKSRLGDLRSGLGDLAFWVFERGPRSSI